MKSTFRWIIVLIAYATIPIGTTTAQSEAEILLGRINKELGQHIGTFALSYRDATTGDQITINGRELFHAASTMKTPVMIEVFKQVAAGKFKLSDSIIVKNEFKSIVDGSPYSLDAKEDSEFTLYKQLGSKRTVRDLMYLMIISSSNLATNLIIEWVDAKEVTRTMRSLGLNDIEVLRGVEDGKAFSKGLNNKVTALDLMYLFDKMAVGQLIDRASSEQMITILRDQKFNEIIPAQLPTEVVVAHKTGWIRGVQHDSGIVVLPDGRRYSLVILSKGLTDEPAAIKSMAAVSRMIYDYAVHVR
jgi:beta-lactamase class A